MYTAIVRRIIRTGFRALSAGDYEHVLRRFHPQVIFSFAGPAPLGGERRGIEAVREWFQRFFSYFPGIQFTVHQVIVQGWPWNTLVATRLSVAAPRSDGSMYQNNMMQFLRLQWGRIIEDQLYEDTYKLVGELQQRERAKQNGGDEGNTRAFPSIIDEHVLRGTSKGKSAR